MKYLDLTLSSPAGNLACDEVLLNRAETGQSGDLLRFWEPKQPFVVLGYANQAEREVNLPACRELGIGVYRRCSGGGTVLQGPGSLDYTLVLGLENHPELGTITGANRFIMECNRSAMEKVLGRPVQIEGHTDLAIGEFKISGNAQRRKRRYLLFHGTFLLEFDLDLIERVLRPPSKEPPYRRGRKHAAFVTNAQIPAKQVKAALCAEWGAETVGEVPPMGEIDQLVVDKYVRDDWNLRF